MYKNFSKIMKSKKVSYEKLLRENMILEEKLGFQEKSYLK